VKETTPQYFTPPEVADCIFPEALDHYDAAMTEAWSSYGKLLACGLKPQIARYVLPNACLTTIVATWNFREIRHIIRLRASPAAQPEMQVIAKEILLLAYSIAPNVFVDPGYLVPQK
jgi:thymidylate synthase (FAD)